MQTPPPVSINSLDTIIATAQRLLDNHLDIAALNLLKANGLKHTIKNGRIIDEDDVTEEFLDRFITCNKEMLSVKDSIRKLSRIHDEVLIAGPTGTGKELLAHALHGKRSGDFKALNCAGLPENLIDSELFGHAQGAFTGATKSYNGLMIAAKDGTFFMDEVGELPLMAQSKLLRVLQENKIRPVGSSESRDLSCRFVFATNRDLVKMCEQGLFRVDLLARISTFEIDTIGLDKRTDDIKLIIESLGGSNELIDKLPADISSRLPFNVRSVQQIVRRYSVLGVLPI